MDAQVEVDAGVRPQRVDGEVGDEGGDRDAELALLARRSEDQGRHRVRGGDDVGPAPPDPPEHLAGGEEIDEDAEGLKDQTGAVPEAVRRLVGPRRVAELEP